MSTTSKLRVMPVVSDEEWAERVAEQDARSQRTPGRGGVRFTGKAPEDADWTAIVDALIEHDYLNYVNRGVAITSEWVKGVRCPAHGGSSFFMRRDDSGGYERGTIRYQCGQKCGGQILRSLGIEPGDEGFRLSDEDGDPRDDFEEEEGVPPPVEGSDYVRARFPLLDIIALVDPDRPPRRWLWEDLIPEGDAVSIVAPAGEGKSLLVLALSIAAMRGDAEFVGRGLTFGASARVLYIDMENSEDDWSERLESLGVDEEEADSLLGVRFFPLSMPRLRGLDTRDGGQELVDVIEAYAIREGDLVVLDSTQRITDGEENSNDTMRKLYRYTAAELKRRGLTVVRTDNTGKDVSRGARGASNKKDDVAGALLLEPDSELPETFTLAPTKRRSRGSRGALVFGRNTDANGRLSFDPVAPSAATGKAEAYEFVRELLERERVPYNKGVNAVWDLVKGHKHEAPEPEFVGYRLVKEVVQDRKADMEFPEEDEEPLA